VIQTRGGAVMDDNALAIFVLILAALFLLVIIMLTIVCIRQQKQIDAIKYVIRHPQRKVIVKGNKE